jgi:hypothetical protein
LPRLGQYSGSVDTGNARVLKIVVAERIGSGRDMLGILDANGLHLELTSAVGPPALQLFDAVLAVFEPRAEADALTQDARSNERRRHAGVSGHLARGTHRRNQHDPY